MIMIIINNNNNNNDNGNNNNTCITKLAAIRTILTAYENTCEMK